MTDGLTIVCPYYQERDLLVFQCGHWFSLPADLKTRLHIIIVDDGSPKMPALPVLRGMCLGIDIQLYKVREDIGWNVGGAKNLGMTHVQTRWAFICDIDHLLPAQSIRFLFAVKCLDEKKIYLLKRKRANGQNMRPGPEIFLLTKDLYWSMGGYDEDYCSRAGCFCINAAIENGTDGREILPIFTTEIHALVPDPNTHVRQLQKTVGLKRYRAVQKQKDRGALPADSDGKYLRFRWRRLL